MLAVPILHAGSPDPRGVILLESLTQEAFYPDDRVLMEDLALYADVAIESAAHYSEVIKHARLTLSLLEAGKSIATLKEPKLIFQSITDAVQEALHCDSVTLYTYDQQKNQRRTGPPAGAFNFRRG